MERWNESLERRLGGEAKHNYQDILQYTQTTGYFRCKHCNGAGNWKLKDPFFGFRILGQLLGRDGPEDGSVRIGAFALYDGSILQWATDSEDHYLQKLMHNGDDSYIWNRVGNLFYNGGRPELAAAAFEKSLQLDSSQIESHYSLGMMLLEIEDWKQAAYHLKMMLLHASHYPAIEALSLREILAVGLEGLYHIHMLSRRKISFLPNVEERMAMLGQEETAAAAEAQVQESSELDIVPGDRQSFYSLAELFMLHRKEEIPAGQRKWKDREIERSNLESSAVSSQSASTSGDLRRPSVFIRVRSQERFDKVARICEEYDLD